MINLHSIAYPVSSLGPGRRIAIWVSGCQRNCDGCISPEMQDPKSGRLISVATLLKRLLSIDAGIDGITLSGGEPMDQKEALTHLLQELVRCRPDWNVILYSGYTLHEVKKMGAVGLGFLTLIDILMDGPFEKGIASTHPLTGSGNQEIRYLSKRGLALKPSFENSDDRRFELGLGTGNFQMLIGVPGGNGFTEIPYLLSKGDACCD